jgi:hypothetical protein
VVLKENSGRGWIGVWAKGNDDEIVYMGKRVEVELGGGLVWGNGVSESFLIKVGGTTVSI